MRKTQALAQVLAVLLDDPLSRHWGYDLSKRTGVRSGVLYPLLHRMLEEGWLNDGWEEATAASGRSRPPRRYYEVTPDGLAALRNLLVEMSKDRRFEALLGGATA